MNNINNPYIIGRPINEPEKFFGRETLFKFINDNLEVEQKTILLFGQRRIGKSSILSQIPKFIQQDKYFFVIFDLQDKFNLPLSDVLYDLAGKIIESLDLSYNEIQLPSITEFEENPNNIFFDKLLPQIYERLNNKNLVLLLDEFDVFINGNEFLKLIRTKGDKIFCIPVLGRNIDDTNIFLAEFHDAPKREIGLLDKESARNLITKPAQNVLEYKPDAIEAILELAAGHPYFTQTICFSVFTQAREKDKWVVERSDIEKIIGDTIEIAEAGLVWFRNALSIPEQVLFSAVAELQKLEFESSDLTGIKLLKKYGVVETDRLKEAVKKLVEWRFLEEIKDSTYKVKIELVRLWLIDKYSLKEVIYKLEEFDIHANQLYKNATENHEEKNIKNAIELYEQVLKINPNHFTTLSRLGELYLDGQDFSKSITCYERCYKLDTNLYKDSLVAAHLKCGEYWIQQKNFKSAREEFHIVLKLDIYNEQAETQLINVAEEIRNALKNPYYVGKFVPAKDFIGRKEEFRIVVSQILNASDWVFYGSHAMGKTSFLKYLAAPETWQKQDENNVLVNNYLFVYLNCKSIDNFTFSIFWQEILKEFTSNKELISKTDFMQSEINQFLQESDLNKNHAKQILQQIKNKDKFLVLLLDNYDGIFEQNNDNNEILKFLREFQYLKEHELGNRLSTIMTASKPLSEVASKDMHDYLAHPSKPFKTFGNVEIVDLWSRMPDLLKQKEDLRKIVQEITGGYPALIQMLCFSLYNQLKDLTQQETPTIETFKTLESEFNDFAEKTLRYIWESLNDTQKGLLILIALYDVRGKIDKKDYYVGDIEDILADSKYKSNIENLKTRGIILFNSVKSEKNIKQKREVYYFAASTMQEWVIREIAGNNQTQVAERERIFLIMTKGQLNTQFSNIKNAMNFIGENLKNVENIAVRISTILNLFSLQ
jgi:tetratricopeptide (TPR) repeat protein